ncbi:MAG: hypothetical protein JST75_20210 [Bacteroidetes bacterium]|nr:hypothetical protein [Bacteroidota bacterium]
MNEQHRNKNSFLLIVWAGLLVGSLDIATALVDYYISTGRGPGDVLRYIASGVFGSKAFTGGDTMIAWGLFFHYVIAFAFTIFFFLIYPHIRAMQKYPVTTAIIYGIFIWAVTNRIIIPLSNTPPPAPFNIRRALKAMTILIIMIGLPLSFMMRRTLNAKR